LVTATLSGWAKVAMGMASRQYENGKTPIVTTVLKLSKTP